jgi:hypothetical protein
MAKRFVDTEQWDRDWYLKLTPKMKCAWEFLKCRCNHAGIWHISMSKMSFEVGEPIELADVTKALPVLVIEGDKLFLPGFVEVQYRCKISELNPENNAHRSVLTILKKYGLDQDLTSPCLAPSEGPLGGAQDKDTDKDMDNCIKSSDEKIESPNSVLAFENSVKFDYQRIFHLYPNHRKQGVSLKLMREKIHTQENYDRLEKAIKNYAQDCITNKRELKYILQFPSFFEEWTEWVDRGGKNQSAQASRHSAASLAEFEHYQEARRNFGIRQEAEAAQWLGTDRFRILSSICAWSTWVTSGDTHKSELLSAIEKFIEGAA